MRKFLDTDSSASQIPDLMSKFRNMEPASGHSFRVNIGDLPDVTKRYINKDLKKTDYKDIIDERYEMFIDLREELENIRERNDYDEEYLDCVEEILDLLSDISETLKTDEDDELNYFLREMEVLNKKITYLNNMAYRKPSNEKEIIETILGKISDEKIIEGNYQFIKQAIEGFLRREIKKEKVKSELENLSKKTGEYKNKYDNIYISRNEWTLETYLGDKYLSQGIKKWQEGLIYLLNNIEHMNEKILLKGLSILYEGNRSLLVTEYLNEYIKKIS
jgi:hypothetical protein